VLVIAGDEVLAVKSWLGDGSWGLPGGGLHGLEDPAQGAIRELKEETGITANSKQLKLLFSKNSSPEHGHRFYYFAYVIELDNKPQLEPQKHEIVELKWIKWHEILDQQKCTKSLADTLAGWLESKKLVS
jgi:8-oxo-dGTP pyrophosphatase MutT (NUDIX family)